MKNETTGDSFLAVKLTAKTWIALLHVNHTAKDWIQLLPVILKAKTWMPLLSVILSERSESKDLVVKAKDLSARLGMTEFRTRYGKTVPGCLKVRLWRLSCL